MRDTHELRAFLEAQNIPLDQWGKGEAKTLEHLFEEVSSGESTLARRNGMLLREAQGGTVNVYYNDGPALLLLREEKQVFSDGRVRTRTLNASIGEKMKRGENPLESAYRALKEELGIHERPPLIPLPIVVKGPIPSPSFPGLHTLYTMYVYDLFLPRRLYRAEGYVERQKDKSSYFVWTKIPDTARA